MMQIQYIDKPIAPLWLVQSHYTIGRSSACDIQLDDSNLLNIHAHLRYDVKTNTLILIQENSAEVSINGEPVHGQAEILHGDKLTIGTFSLTVIDSSQQAIQPNDGWTIYSAVPNLEKNEFTIIAPSIVGRGTKCDIRIEQGAQLSRRHARLSVVGSDFFVEDLSSSNGTFVNGERVEKAKLSHDDEISFAGIKFHVKDPFFDDQEEKTAFINLNQASNSIQSQPEKSGPTAIERQLKIHQQRAKLIPADENPKHSPIAQPSENSHQRKILFISTFIILSLVFTFLLQS